MRSKGIFINRTGNYYRNLRDAGQGIDNELTISHVLKSENRFTKGGKTFGRILAEKLKIPKDPRILEVGPGLGDVAEEITRGLDNFHYTFADLSHGFVDSLKKKFTGDRFSFLIGDFLKMDIRDRFDLIICNEVMADLPTIVNMTLDKPQVEEDDKDEYYDAVSLVKLYGLELPKTTNFNYGAVKFVEKVKGLLNEGGKVFISEHSSKVPKIIKVQGHNEYTINFSLLEEAAKKMGFRTRRGKMSDLLGMNRENAILFYTQPELKALYGFLKKQDIILEQKAYKPDEVIEILEETGVNISGRKDYIKFLQEHANPLRDITCQFNYLILQSPVKK